LLQIDALRTVTIDQLRMFEHKDNATSSDASGLGNLFGKAPPGR
jgi:hypothetical protein